MKKRESPDFRSPEVSISVRLCRSPAGYSPIKVTGCSSYLLGVYICGLVRLRVLKPKMTAARVVSVRIMTILSKSSWGKKCSKVMFSTIKFAVPVIKFVVVELNLRGGNEFGTRP